MSEHTILVAFTVEAQGPLTAQNAVVQALGHVTRPQDHTSGQVTSWWIAEDGDRIDGSDLDSAVFCKPEHKWAASKILHMYGLTGSCNVTPQPEWHNDYWTALFDHADSLDDYLEHHGLDLVQPE